MRINPTGQEHTKGGLSPSSPASLLEYSSELSSLARPEASSARDAGRCGWMGGAGVGSLGSSSCCAFMAVAWSWARDLTGLICRPPRVPSSSSPSPVAGGVVEVEIRCLRE
jgi:hypothetical protein